MPVANTKSLENSVLRYLEARPGEKFNAMDLSKQFGCTAETVRDRLNMLVKKEKIEKFKDGREAFYFSPVKMQPAAKRESTVFGREYVLPAVMRDRAQEAQALREQYPSKHV